MVFRVWWHNRSEAQLIAELLASFDTSRDHHLNLGELEKLLDENGFDIDKQQVKTLFGRMDIEGDGFDGEELSNVVEVVAHMPTASHRIQAVAASQHNLALDMFVVCVSGAGLFYILNQSDNIERKWAASYFRSAVTFRRMQANCSKLDAKLLTLSEERSNLMGKIKTLECTSYADASQRKEELDRHQNRLEKVQTQMEATKGQLNQEVVRWREQAEACMREATLAKAKMEGILRCVKGLDGFNGTGKAIFGTEGAQQGFCDEQRGMGFASDSIMFGTIENGKLLMYETAKTKKLGEGKDCAFRCTDLSTGRELALKMYNITNPAQRQAIHHDLYAHRSQVGKHPNIVSYERVIESKDTIFVLMELIAGKDLFDVVASRKLSEQQARILFRDLCQALQYLHDKQVIHCDVKPENAMVCGDIDKGTVQVKLIDFGCSCFEAYEKEMQRCVVYDTYLPPEHAGIRSRPTVATDMWRLGCTLYVMLVRRPPFYPDADTETGRATRQQGKFFRTPEFEALSDEAKDLISQLVVGDPTKRPTTAEVLKHKWLSMDCMD